MNEKIVVIQHDFILMIFKISYFDHSIFFFSSMYHKGTGIYSLMMKECK